MEVGPGITARQLDSGDDPEPALPDRRNAGGRDAVGRVVVGDGDGVQARAHGRGRDFLGRERAIGARGVEVEIEAHGS